MGVLDDIMGPRRDGQGGGGNQDGDGGQGDGPSDGNQPRPDRDPRETRIGGLIAVENTVVSMLDLRLLGGQRTALPYSYLASIDFDPSKGVVCAFASGTVTITGRDLEPVYTAITNHTALAVVQAESGFDEGSAGPFVETIVIERVGDKS